MFISTPQVVATISGTNKEINSRFASPSAQVLPPQRLEIINGVVIRRVGKEWSAGWIYQKQLYDNPQHAKCSEAKQILAMGDVIAAEFGLNEFKARN